MKISTAESRLNGMLPMLKRWNAADPPNQRERLRNKAIELLQGHPQPVY